VHESGLSLVAHYLLNDAGLTFSRMDALPLIA
jgi:hypothetical protein